MTLWQDPPKRSKHPSATHTDVIFKIACDRLPVDHGRLLADAVTSVAPWLQNSPGSGVHPVYVAGSQNGWERPVADSGEDLILSRRTRLIVRADTDHCERLIEDLAGTRLDVGDSVMGVLEGRQKPLIPAQTLYARNVFFETNLDDENEDAFMQRVVSQCRDLDFDPTRVLTGKSQQLGRASGSITTRSVLIDAVPATISLRLQSSGIGDERLMGCGLFIPHKSIDAVHDTSE